MDFCLAVEKGLADAMMQALDMVQSAMKDGKWQAAAWLLERRWPEKFGRQRHEITGADGGPVEVQTDEAQKVKDRLNKIADRLRNEGVMGAAGAADTEGKSESG